jgi:hypothetical protein
MIHAGGGGVTVYRCRRPAERPPPPGGAANRLMLGLGVSAETGQRLRQEQHVRIAGPGPSREAPYAGPVAAPRPGEEGYGDWSVEEVEAGRCPCTGCPGTLTDPARSPSGWGHCRVCRCAYQVKDRGGGWRTAEWIPAYGRGTCARADVQMASWRRQLDEEERLRRLQE